MPMSEKDLRGVVSIASRYTPGGAAPKRKTLVQEISRRLKLRRKKKADDKRYKEMTKNAATRNVRRGLSQAGVDRGSYENY